MIKNILFCSTLLSLSFGQNIYDPDHYCDFPSKRSCSYYRDIERRNSDLEQRVRSIEVQMKNSQNGVWTGGLRGLLDPGEQTSGDLSTGTEFVMEVIAYYSVLDDNPVTSLMIQSEQQGILSMFFLNTDLFANHTLTAGPNIVDVISSFGISPRLLRSKTLYCISSVNISLIYYGKQGDAYSVWPFQSLGTRYLVPSYNGAGTLDIVGIKNDTEVTVELTDDGHTINHTVRLSYLQTKNYTGYDIAGSIITSNEPIAVFTHQFTNIPLNQRYADHIGEQCFDTKYLGTKYLLTPFRGRVGYIYRVSVIQRLTLINIYGFSGLLEENVPVSVGSYTERTLNNSDNIIIISNKPIQVTMFAKSNSVDGVGDPTMVTLTALDKLVAGETKVSIPMITDYPDNYMTVIARESNTRGLLKLNNELAVGMEGIEITTMSVEGDLYTIYSIPLSDRHYLVKHPESFTEFSMLVYGFRSSNREGYGFYVIRG